MGCATNIEGLGVALPSSSPLSSSPSPSSLKAVSKGLEEEEEKSSRP